MPSVAGHLIQVVVHVRDGGSVAHQEGFHELVDVTVQDALGVGGVVAGADRIVLGCTHYPFLRPVIEAIAGPGVQVIDPAPAVARQTVRLLEKDCIPLDEGPFRVDLYFSGEPESLRRIFALLSACPR